jgi:LPXTG-motif cell wall-anchored protein
VRISAALASGARPPPRVVRRRSVVALVILVGVFGARPIVTWMLVLGALALAVPAATLAAGGGSAGDNQYTDPFASSTAPTTASHTQPTVTTAPAPAVTSTTAPATAAPPATAPPTTAPPAAAPPTSASTVPVTPTTPIATTDTDLPATATATASAAAAGTTVTPLPHTGFEDWLAAVAGLVLVAGGLTLRAKTRGA